MSFLSANLFQTVGELFNFLILFPRPLISSHENTSKNNSIAAILLLIEFDFVFEFSASCIVGAFAIIKSIRGFIIGDVIELNLSCLLFST